MKIRHSKRKSAKRFQLFFFLLICCFFPGFDSALGQTDIKPGGNPDGNTPAVEIDAGDVPASLEEKVSTPGDPGVISRARFLPSDMKAEKGKVYKSPSFNSRVIGFLEKGEDVLTILRHKDWYVIKFSDDRVGWVPKAAFLEPEPFELPEENSIEPFPLEKLEEDSAKKLILAVTPAGLRETPDPKTEVNVEMNLPEKMILTDKKGNWLLVELESGQSGWLHSNFVSPAATPDEPRKEGPALVKAVGGDVSRDDAEHVKIQLDRFAVPETFVIDGHTPRIVCDFFAATPHQDIEPEIALNGDFIEKIRIGKHKTPEIKVRVVLDLFAGKDYDVQQVFFKKENLYQVTVIPK